MQNRRYDALVVGGGPTGATVAQGIAAAGLHVAVVEAASQIGRPVQCSGLVTPRTLRLAELTPDIALNALHGARVFSPGGADYEIGGNQVHAYALDRADFDQLLMERALDAGAELFTSTRVTSLEPATAGGVTAYAQHHGKPLAFSAPLLIGADGPRSLVAQYLDLPPPAEVLRARGAEVRLPHAEAAGDQVQIFLGERLSPGFFAWAIPLGGRRYRIGWGAGTSGPQHGLRALVDSHPDFFAGMEVVEQTGGLIPIGPRPRTVAAGGMVIGDAAGHAKATSGGGLYTSLSCAQECARVAVAAIQAGDTSQARLAGYEEAWRAGVGVELDRAATLRNIYRRLGDDDLEWGLRLLRLSRVRDLVDRDGDIDYPSWLAGSTLRAVPGIRRLFGGDRRAANELGRAAVAAGG